MLVSYTSSDETLLKKIGPVLFHALEDLGYTDNGKDLQLTRLFYQRGGPESCNVRSLRFACDPANLESIFKRVKRLFDHAKDLKDAQAWRGCIRFRSTSPNDVNPTDIPRLTVRAVEVLSNQS